MTTPPLSPYDLGLIHYATWNEWARQENREPPTKYTVEAGDMDALCEFHRGIADAKNGDARAVAVAFARLDGFQDDMYIDDDGDALSDRINMALITALEL